MPYRLIEDSAPQETLVKKVGRNIARGATRASEAALGLPGDITSGLLGLANKGIEKFTGKPSQMIQDVRESLPTSQYIRENVTSKIINPKVSEPQGKIEQFVDDLIGDMVSLAAPIKGKSLSPLSTFSRAFAGNISKEAATALGIGEGGQEIAKIGAMTLAGFPGTRRSILKAKDSSYKVAEQLADTAKDINANELVKDVQSVIKEVRKRDLPGSKFIQDRALGILKHVKKTKKGLKISVKDAWNAKKDLNKYFKTDIPVGSQEYLKNLVCITKEAVKKFDNPEFLQNFNFAEEIETALNNRSRIGNFLEKHVSIDSLKKNPLAKSLLLGGVVKYGGAGTAAQAIAGSVGAREAARVIDLLRESPEAQRIYGTILSDSLLHNSKNLARDIPKLEEALSKKQIKGRYRLID